MFIESIAYGFMIFEKTARAADAATSKHPPWHL